MAPDILAIERAGIKAWPGLETAHDRGWIMRAAGGHTKRANSVQSLDPEDDEDASARLSDAARWFTARSLPPVFRVTPLAGDAVVAELDAGGWEPFEFSQVLVAEPRAAPRDPRVESHAPDSAEWLAVQQQLQGYSDHKVDMLRGIVRQIAPPVHGLVIRSESGAPAAAALLAVVDGICFSGNVVTAADQRRKGFARTLMQSSLAIAAKEGASAAVLQVLADNEAAQGLYASLGYRRHYDYHHRRLRS